VTTRATEVVEHKSLCFCGKIPCQCAKGVNVDNYSRFATCGKREGMNKKLGIALRRYLFTDVPCKQSSAYFGCSREFLRAFLRAQLGRLHWLDYGKKWCVGHTLPIHIFGDTTAQLKQCWNWANLRIVPTEQRRGSLSAFQAHQRLQRLSNDMRKLDAGTNGFIPDKKQLGKLTEKAFRLALRERYPEDYVQVNFKSRMKKEMEGVE